jgi:hypothetical protein
MKNNRTLPKLFAALLCSGLSLSPATAQSVSLSDAHAAVLQTDGPRAARLFEQLLTKSSSLSKWDQRRARCSIARLTGKSSIPLPTFSGDEFADRIIAIYRAY